MAQNPIVQSIPGDDWRMLDVPGDDWKPLEIPPLLEAIAATRKAVAAMEATYGDSPEIRIGRGFEGLLINLAEANMTLATREALGADAILSPDAAA